MKSVKITNLDVNGFYPETENSIPTDIDELEGYSELDQRVADNTNKVTTIDLTEQEISGQKTGKLIFTDAEGQEHEVQGGFPPDNTSIILTNSNQLQAKGLVTQTGYLSGDVIKEVISAQGGYLDSHDFGTSTPTNQELTDYAIQNIGTITQADEIWDKTRVINLYDHHTWVWDLRSKTWSDLGEIAQISDANNEGLHGLVTGAPNDGEHDYMGNIDANGQININGLPELAQQVNDNTSNIATNTQNISINTSDISTNTANISNNTTAINNEVINRQNADSNLQSQINQLDTNKQDKLIAGEHIDITNNVIDTKDVITLGTEEQTFAGQKNLVILSNNQLSNSLKIVNSESEYRFIELNPYCYHNNKYTPVIRLKSYPSNDDTMEIGVNYITTRYNKTINIPNKSGTFALTSDIPTLKTFTNTSVSQADWVADSTYTDYGYKATITLSDVTADMIPQVIFGATEATSGNYLPIAESFAGGIYIYSKVNDAITIPTIIVQKAV